MSNEAQKFRVKIPTLWRQAFPGMVLGALVGRLHLWIQGEPFSLPNTIPLMILAALVVATIYLLQPTVMDSEGIRAMTYWGIRRKVSWSSVKTVRIARLYLVQPSLKIEDDFGRSYWIALDTKNLNGMHALSKKLGGENHPLTKAPETPLYAL